MSNVSTPKVMMPPIPFDPTTPLHLDEFGGWNVHSYDHVKAVLTDDAHFSASYGLAPGEDHHPIFAGMWAADDPRHRDLRAIAADPFRQRHFVQLSQNIRKIIDDLLESVMDRKSLEVVSEFARPLAFRVIATILDVDREDYKRFIIWQDELRAVQKLGQVPVQPDFVEYLRAFIRDRQVRPRSGLIDELIRAYRGGYQVDGKALTEWDLIGYLATLLTAGGDTTAAGLANALVSLIQFDCLSWLHANPHMVSSALEEALRYNPAFPGIRRNVKQDVKLGKEILKKGEYITAWVSAANRDPLHFQEPQRFLISRSPNRHLTFGWAKHHCLGSHLARLQMQTAITAFIERIPLEHLSIARPVKFSFSVVNAPKEVHVVWS